jgi:hypothetical protein
MIRKHESRKISWKFCRLDRKACMTIRDELPTGVLEDDLPSEKPSLHDKMVLLKREQLAGEQNCYDSGFHAPDRAPLWRRRLFRRWAKMIQGRL